MNLELWPRRAEKNQKEIRIRKSRTVRFYATRIEENPLENANNPICKFEFDIPIHKSSFGYGAAAAGLAIANAGEEIKFLIRPSLKESIWHWFAQNMETGETGYIWTTHRSRGTVISRRKGLNRTPTLIGKSGYDKYKKLQDIAFIEEDII